MGDAAVTSHDGTGQKIVRPEPESVGVSANMDIVVTLRDDAPRRQKTGFLFRRVPRACAGSVAEEATGKAPNKACTTKGVRPPPNGERTESGSQHPTALFFLFNLIANSIPWKLLQSDPTTEQTALRCLLFHLNRSPWFPDTTS